MNDDERRNLIPRLAVPGVFVLLCVGGFLWWDAKWYPDPFNYAMDPFAPIGFKWDSSADMKNNYLRFLATLRSNKGKRITRKFLTKVQSSETYWREGHKIAMKIDREGNVEFRRDPKLEPFPFPCEEFNQVSFQYRPDTRLIVASFSNSRTKAEARLTSAGMNQAEFDNWDPFQEPLFPNFSYDPTSEFFDSLFGISSSSNSTPE